jgi:hypothetical protein
MGGIDEGRMEVRMAREEGNRVKRWMEEKTLGAEEREGEGEYSVEGERGLGARGGGGIRRRGRFINASVTAPLASLYRY